MKFNLKRQKQTESTTINLAGGEAFTQSAKLELVTMLLTCFLENQYYRKAGDSAKRLQELIREINDKPFVAKAALYARREAGMRSVSHLVAGELAHQVKGADWTRRFFDRVVYRVDDVLEILAYHMAVHGKPLPNSLKKGLGQALTRFDAYQLAKYRREGAELKLVDAVNLLHPPHTQALGQLMAGTLQPAETWETKLTQAGQQAENAEDKAGRKAGAWADLIRSRKIGYFALLRNLRNILEQSPDVVDDALALLQDPRLIRKSLVLPFRFRTALDAVEQATDLPNRQKVIRALSKAVDLALENVPVLEGRTLIALDSSGSMHGNPIKIGSLFASVLYKTNDADLMLFSDIAEFKTFNRDDSTLSLAQRMEEKARFAGTNFHAIFQTARKAYDRVVILSDMQGWMGYYTPTESFEAYVKKAGNRPRVYSFDLAGYGSLQFPERGVYALAGFSDKTMETLMFLEKDKSALLHQIEAMEL
tara:strand:- start:800 stop:2233 length:1434 start_codon:yes stop_codon:yes gene_type:complete